MTVRDVNSTHVAAPRRRRWIVVGIAVVGIVLAALLVTWPFAPSVPNTASPVVPAPDAVEASEDVNAQPPVTPETADLKPDVVNDDFWRNMLESTECNLVTGYGPASNTAVVVGPARDGATEGEPTEGGGAFRVVDDTGILFEGELPFKPSRTWLGRHSDGRVLAGFSYLRLSSKVRRDPSSPEPVVVYQDGEKIYQTEKAWSLDVAFDGSAFFTIEPEPDDTSNLIIRDIDGAVVRSHDLEYVFTALGDESPYLARFTNDRDEVMLIPYSLPTIHQDHFFYPVGGGKSRAVRYQGVGVEGGVLASSKTGFYVHQQGPDGPQLVVRRQFNWDSPTEGISEVWTTEVDLDHYYGTTVLSDDNRYLLLRAWNTHLLDAETGRILFAHPTTENLGRGLRDAPHVGKVTAAGVAYRKADRERLASVIDEDGDRGGIRDYGFRDGDLYIYREVGLDELRRCSAEHRDDRDAARACKERLRVSGVHSDVLDLFDLANIQIDSQPDRRVTIDRSEHECRPGPKSGLAFDDGTLRYVGRED